VPAVSNSSPLIYLSVLKDLNLLHDLLGAIVIPSAVYREVVVDGQGQPGASEVEKAVGDWITPVDVEDRFQVNRLQSTLGLQVGECEAIILAGQLHIVRSVVGGSRLDHVPVGAPRISRLGAEVFDSGDDAVRQTSVPGAIEQPVRAVALAGIAK